jgi:mono/diheme cytochrome c family protein
MREVALIAALALAASPALAQSAGQWRDPPAIWAASCAYCHGTGVGPPLKGAHPAPATISWAMRHGMPGMPAYHPSEINADELARFADWLSKQPAPPAVKP